MIDLIEQAIESFMEEISQPAEEMHNIDTVSGYCSVHDAFCIFPEDDETEVDEWWVEPDAE